jgi:hypothetical protein
MSCEQGINQVGRTAGIRAGISRVAGKAGSVIGSIAGQMAQANDTAVEAVGRRVAPVSNRVLPTVDRPATVLANTVPALALLASCTQARWYTVGPTQGARPAVAVAIGLREFGQMRCNLQALGRLKAALRQGRLAGSVAADAAVAAAETPGEPRILTQSQKGFLRDKVVEVSLTKSRLIGLLNRGDRLVSSSQVVSSQGDLVRAKGGPFWHQGTTVVKTGQGEQTITHLRSLTLPSTSYYFNRPLSETETAGLVTGQVKAHKLAGYVGTVSEMENLTPAWAQAKRAMILTRLHWPAEEAPTNPWRIKSGEADPSKDPSQEMVSPERGK